jgi:hypothetical protein
VGDPEGPAAPPTADQRRQALQRGGWLTRDGEVLDDRDRVLGWLVDRGALSEMYRPSGDS